MSTPSALPCIWMAAGLLAYKLCDRELDCENCPLDAALCRREYPPAEAAVGDAALSIGDPSLEELEFPDDRLYHPAHTWAQVVDGSRVRTGLDAFAAKLLAHLASVILPVEGAPVRQGGVGFWIREESRLLPLLSPVSGTLRHCNGCVRSRPDLLPASPYDEGWLAEIDCADWRTQSRELISAQRMRERVEHQMETFRKRVSRYIDRDEPVLGPTLADGGERLIEARRILGPERFWRVVQQLLR